MGGLRYSAAAKARVNAPPFRLQLPDGLAALILSGVGVPYPRSCRPVPHRRGCPQSRTIADISSPCSAPRMEWPDTPSASRAGRLLQVVRRCQGVSSPFLELPASAWVASNDL